MSRRIATIDCGTNTIFLLIADVDGNVLVDREEIVGLGRGFDRTGVLAAEAIARTLAVLGQYVAVIAQHRCDVVAAVGTEAIRKAKNSGDFVTHANALLAKVGAALEVIAGNREAQLCWRAAREICATRPLSVLDIGGGSTEFVVGDSDDAAQTLASLPIGSVRLSERFLASDPPSAAQIAQTCEAIATALTAAPALHGTLIALAGTATTLASIAAGGATAGAINVHNTRLSRRDLDSTIDRLAILTLAQKQALPGLHRDRAAYILAGGLILQAVMTRGNFAEMIVSDRGVRWGLYYEHLR